MGILAFLTYFLFLANILTIKENIGLCNPYKV